ncbi:MAG: glycosyltransferase family A protein [Candidatus Hinthialibacter antarcticus]|nr:glycosyltransferase family A protein [Candidatus Hinthialibacter antarcticus]
MTKPFISTIVRTYNRPDRLRECLQTLAAQTFDSFEVVVVNDAGEDVREIVEDELAGVAHHYMCNPVNRGRTANLNIGVNAANGEYVSFVDDDDGVLPHFLQTLADAARPQQLPMVYSDVLNVTFQQDPHTHEWKRVQEQLIYSFDFEKDNFLLANYVPINCWLVRKDCFDAVGPFDESLTVYEDWEFLIRLSRKFNFQHVSKVTGEYRRRDDNSNILEQESYKANDRTVKRRYRRDRDAVFDPIFKSTFQKQRETRQALQQAQQYAQQNQVLKKQMAEAQRVIQDMQTQMRQLREGRP